MDLQPEVKEGSQNTQEQDKIEIVAEENFPIETKQLENTTQVVTLVPSSIDEKKKVVLVPERDELGRIKKGFSGNPLGRPQGKRNLTTILEEVLKRKANKKGITYAELLIENLVKKATKKEHFESQKLVLSYTDGLPTQKVEVSEQILIWDED